MQEKIKKGVREFALPAVSLAAGLIIGLAWSSGEQVVDTERYPLLAKRIQVENPNDPKLNFVPLRRTLEEAIQVTQGDNAGNVSVYFEYLPSGVSIHINERNESIAASLMKVPAVMTLYRAAAMGQVDLDRKVALKQEWLNSQYGTLYKKGVGYELTLREAAGYTLRESDNTAILMIFDELGGLAQSPDNLTNFIDLEFDTRDDERALIGAQSYSSILKCLYFACYNTKEDSQEILSYLSESTFKDRLMRYLPEDTIVAHKIGTFSEEYQSDCGIFYVPERNYLLCVMVKGADPEASKTIADISNKTYQYVANDER